MPPKTGGGPESLSTFFTIYPAHKNTEMRGYGLDSCVARLQVRYGAVFPEGMVHPKKITVPSGFFYSTFFFSFSNADLIFAAISFLRASRKSS